MKIKISYSVFSSINIVVYVFIVLKIILSYYIPLNILPGAPHDDTLFYNLANNISKIHWLGDFNGLSHIKGFVYPLFISFSILFHIPIRILESLLICFTAYYFVKTLNDFFPKKYTWKILFIIIIFYPLQYGFTDYRLLRDMIYPQLILILFTSIIRITTMEKISNIYKSNKDQYIFGISLYLCFNTREETIWVTPVILILLSSYIISNRSIIKFINNFKLSLVIYLIFFSMFHIINYYKYTSWNLNIFKSQGFQNGYTAIHSLKKDRLLLDGISRDEFNTLFTISPELSRIKKYINSDSFTGWINTACFAHESQGKDINAFSHCPEEMPTAFLLFALTDALIDLGLKSPDEIDFFMQKVADEIKLACNNKTIQCENGGFNLLPPKLINLDFPYDLFINRIKHGIDIIKNFSNPHFSAILPPDDLDAILKIRNKLNTTLFAHNDNDSKNLINNEYNIKDINNSVFNSKNYAGYVDSIIIKGNDAVFNGWAYDNGRKFQKILIVSNSKIINICDITLNRKDIDINNYKNIGFICNINYSANINEISELKFIVLDEQINKYYRLNVIDYINSSLSGKYDEKCYFKYNPDVENAVREGKLRSGLSHWKEFSFEEKRPCFNLSLLNTFENSNRKKYNSYVIDGNHIFSIIFNYISISYSFILSMGYYFILFALYVIIVNRNLNLLFIYLSFLLLVILRLILITLLDIVGSAPLSGLYLATSLYFYFILTASSLLLVTHDLSNRFRVNFPFIRRSSRYVP